jgi:hypothetical protein
MQVILEEIKDRAECYDWSVKVEIELFDFNLTLCQKIAFKL